MKKSTKTVLAVAGAIVALGIILCAAVLIFSGEDLKAYKGRGYIYKEYVCDASLVKGLRIKDKNTEVYLLPADDGKIKACYYEAEDDFYDVTLSKGGYLEIIRMDKKRWPRNLGIFNIPIRDADLTVYVPSDMLEEINAATSNGSIEFGSIDLSGSLVLSSSNGKITAENFSSGGDVYISTSNSRIDIASVEAPGMISAETSNGRVTADSISAAEVSLENSNGSVSAINVAADSLTIESSNGDVSVDGIRSGDIELTTSNSRISGSITGSMSDYAITSRTSNADNNLPNGTEGDRRLDVHTSNGSIDITFTEG